MTATPIPLFGDETPDEPPARASRRPETSPQPRRHASRTGCWQLPKPPRYWGSAAASCTNSWRAVPSRQSKSTAADASGSRTSTGSSARFRSPAT